MTMTYPTEISEADDIKPTSVRKKLSIDGHVTAEDV